jgi:Mrp family chromosome partitioning ATPase
MVMPTLQNRFSGILPGFMQDKWWILAAMLAGSLFNLLPYQGSYTASTQILLNPLANGGSVGVPAQNGNQAMWWPTHAWLSLPPIATPHLQAMQALSPKHYPNNLLPQNYLTTVLTHSPQPIAGLVTYQYQAPTPELAQKGLLDVLNRAHSLHKKLLTKLAEPPTDQNTPLTTRINQLTKQLANLRTQRQHLESRLNANDLQAEATLLVKQRLSAQQTLTELSSKLAAARVTAKAPITTGAEGFLTPAAQKRLQASTIKHRHTAQSSLNALQQQYQVWQAQLNQLTQQEHALPAKRHQLATLTQQEQDALLKLDVLKNQQNQSLLPQSAVVPWSMVVAPVIPQQPDFPSINQRAGLLMLLGGLLGLAFSLIKTFVQGRTPRLKDIHQLTNTPIVCSIPWFTNGLFEADKLASVHYAYSGAMAQLQNYCRDQDCQVLAVTSDYSALHRPTVLLQLAHQWQQCGLRIALVDANLRTPVLACQFDTPHKTSLTSLINDLDNTPNPVEQQSLIAAYGHVEPEHQLTVFLNQHPEHAPQVYLYSKGFERLIAGLRERFDRILVNTPCALQHPEALTAMHACDGVILVTSHGIKAPRLQQLTATAQHSKRPLVATLVRA